MTADLRFALLGPVRAWHGQTELDLGAPQQRSVLAAPLPAEGGHAPMGARIDGLWAADPPRTAAGTVRTYVSRLRRVLGLADGLIESAGGGDPLGRGGVGLDLDSFVLLTGKARASHAGPARAARLLRQGLAPWAGGGAGGLPGRAGREPAG